MSFLNPIMLAGLGAIAVPILIHLLNRRRFRKVVWAAMKFLQISIEKNQRRMRIEDLILLALRCLLLVLLALALARPALLSQGGNLLGQSKVTGVVILDNSYSMNMSDGIQTRFDKARETAEQAVDSMSPGSAAAVFLASDTVDTPIPEPTYDLNLARKAIREAPLTDRATDLFPAINQAVDLLQDRLALRKEIFVVTDGQAAAWRQLADIRALLEHVRGDIKTHLILVDEGETRNLGITNLRLASGLSPVDQPLRFEAQVSNYGQEEARDIRVSLSANKEPPSDAFTIEQLPAGTSRTVSLFTRLHTLGFHAITASIDRDRLPSDDLRTLAVRAIRQINVLLVDGDPGQEPRDSEVYFLRHALAPVAEDRRAEFFIQSKTIVTPELSLASLDDFDAVVLANVADLSDEAVQKLTQYVRRGGGLLVFPGDRVQLDFYKTKLFEDHALLPAAFGAPRGEATQDTDFIRLQEKDYPHAITALWNDPAAGTLGSARFFRHAPLQPATGATTNASPADPARPAGPARVVLHYADGSPAVLERDWGLGRVIQFSSTADTAWNDHPVRPSFLPFMHRCLGALVQRQDEGLNLRVGEPFRRRLEPEFLGKEATVLKPRQTETLRDLRRVELIDGWPVLDYEATDFAGLYEAAMTDPPLDMKFATQADGRESNLDRLSSAQKETLQDVANVVAWTPDLSLKALVQQERTGLEFWLPIVAFALGVALVETFLGQWFSRSK